MTGQRQHAELDAVLPISGHGKDAFYRPADKQDPSGGRFPGAPPAVGAPGVVCRNGPR